MHVKLITKAYDLFNRVVTLDQEIKSLECHADTLLDEDKTVKLHLDFETAIPEPVPDSHGDISPTAFFRAYHNPLQSAQQQFSKRLKTSIANKPTEQKAYDLNNSEALYVLGALLAVKNDRRKALVNELLEIGYRL